ncbi:MAG TPA: DNA-formamidopyrimidine glycosylase family protein, partial [Gemmatimonadales bacterium]|nr:DNA-formamidopyrimidine glycosylase family protein [Gemmatimonadales bacterium]
TLYLEHLAARVLNQTLEQVVVRNPFGLRSFDHPISETAGKRVLGLRRLGKRIVFALEGNLFLVFHLMIAGRLKWYHLGRKAGGKLVLAVLEFPHGLLFLTEAGTKRRASIHLVSGEAALQEFERGGLEVLESDLASFAQRLTSENHTLKRALTDPRLFSGIGNAYSDEILHCARLSPMALTRKLDQAAIDRLYQATRATLQAWIVRLRDEAGDEFPERVTAFRAGMAVHGRYQLPCPDCGSPVQRIRYADNETNYCARCQTGGRLLADRAMSRLLRQDWPRSIDEVE